ncbi:MAG: class I SAM-dependent methyltransferase [Pseudomonadota bacterium]
MHWTHGYVQDIDYIHGYCRELAPSLLALACASRGLAVQRGDRPLRYLELGFGQGLSVNVHAAACPGEFWGTDFNPSHVVNARELAAAAGSGARLFDDSFAELLERAELPEFDVIAMHGTWSWISTDNRRMVAETVRRKLAPGGLFYVSYNCLPGSTPELPLRQLLKLHTDVASSTAEGIPAKIDAALAFAQSLLDAGARYFNEHDQAKESLSRMRSKSKNYLAHEYLNQDWQPMAFAEVAQVLNDAKLDFAGSAHLIDHLDGVGAPEKARKLLEEIQHPVMRETVRDYLTNQRFRRDVFVKGLRRLPVTARDEQLFETAFVLLAHPEQLPKKVSLPYGEAELNPELYGALVAALAEDRFAPKSIRQLEQHPLCRKIRPAQFVQALRLLVGAGQLHPAQSESVVSQVSARCRRLNAHILDRALHSNEITVLASPVTGSGITVNNERQLFLHARARGLETEEQWARYAWDRLATLGVRLVKDRKTLESAEENLAHLRREAKLFAEQGLAVLEALGIA